MNLLYLDMETHYEPKGGYSLSKMPTMQYIRDSRFECLGCAVQADGEPVYVQPGDLQALFDATDWSQTVAVAHNAQFDGAILHEVFGHSPAFWIDTKAWTQYAISQGALPPDASTSIRWWGEFLGLAKGDTADAVAAGGDDLAEYGIRDVEIMVGAHHWLQEHCPLPDLEARTIDWHVRMAAEPQLRLDVPMLERLAADTLDPELAKKIRSRETFAAALRAVGVEPGTKTSPANGKQTYAFAKTDRFMRELLRHPDPRARLLGELKQQGASTLVAARSQRFLDVGEPMPVPLRYYGAHTGRGSGSDFLNMQNLPRGEFRNALVAPPGYLLAAADYSQVEARVVAWGAGDGAALAPFTSGLDPYKVVAARDLYNCDYDAVDDEMRRRAKAAVLALGFGQGANGFVTYCENFGIDMDAREAAGIVDAWRRSRPRLVEWWFELFHEVLSQGELTLPSGRKLTYPDIERRGRETTYKRHKPFSKSAGRDTVNLWHGLVAENWTQAVARDIIYHAAVRMPARAIMQIHDEVVLLVPEDRVDELLPEIERTMLALPAWADGLPVACEIAVGRTYAECK
jgi:DNA polymerase